MVQIRTKQTTFVCSQAPWPLPALQRVYERNESALNGYETLDNAATNNLTFNTSDSPNATADSARVSITGAYSSATYKAVTETTAGNCLIEDSAAFDNPPTALASRKRAHASSDAA